jgi:hypothetical protein
MKKQALTTIGIKTFAPSAAHDERPRPVSEDSEAYASKPEGRGRAALRWFIDTLALAGCGMAGVYVGVWLEPHVTPQPTRLPQTKNRPDLSVILGPPEGQWLASTAHSSPIDTAVENGSGIPSFAAADHPSADGRNPEPAPQTSSALDRI